MQLECTLSVSNLFHGSHLPLCLNHQLLYFSPRGYPKNPVTSSMKKRCCIMCDTQHHKMTQFFSRWCQPNKNKSDSHYVFLSSLNMIIKFSLMHISLWTPSWADFNMYSALIEKCCHLTKKKNNKKDKNNYYYVQLQTGH